MADHTAATSSSAAPARVRDAEAEAEARSFAIDAARLLRDNKCEQVIVLDVRELSSVMDYLVIASGTSDRQMNSTLDDVTELAQQQERSAFRTSKDDRSTWLLADFADVVVHLFEPNTRAHYDLEMLWGDAGRVDWKRTGENEATDKANRADR